MPHTCTAIENSIIIIMFIYFSIMSRTNVRVVHSRRGAAQAAIALLYADNSDEEIEALDDEDESFIDDDRLVDADETIIGNEENDDEEEMEVEMSGPASNCASIKWTRSCEMQPIEVKKTIAFGSVKLDGLEESVTPYEVFDKTFQMQSLVENIILPQSVLYAQRKGEDLSTNHEELKALLGLHILMGYHKLPEQRDYWKQDDDLHVSKVSQTMTSRRFETLRSHLHFNDNEANHSGRSWKIQPVLDHANKAFQDAYEYEEELSIDEHMVKFKGNNSIKQYMKGKPTPWGFKEWILAAAKSGYAYQVHLYTGKDPKSTNLGLGEQVVMKLSQCVEGTGCVLGMDNFFTSINLLESLHENGIKAVGTIRSHRKGLPTKVREAKKMKEGEIHPFVSENGKVSVCAWMDKRLVLVASNYVNPSEMTVVERRRRGQPGKQPKSIPSVVVRYNSAMKGVDLCDQKKVSYEIGHRSPKKYYLRIFFDLLDIAINNAYVVYCSKKLETISSYEFRRSVANSMIRGFSSRERQSKCGPPSKRLRIRLANTPLHLPKVHSVRKRCNYCSSRLVDNRSNIQCTDCDVALCLNSNRNCFRDYHM